MSFLGIKPKLSNIVLDNIMEKQAESAGYVPTPVSVALKCGFRPCRKRLKGFTYHCPYCNKIYCENHRLPEDHGCDNPSLPYFMRVGSGQEASSEENRESEAQRN